MRHVLALAAGLGLTTTEDLTIEAAARFVGDRLRSVSANTVRGELDYLRAACNLAVDEGWLDRPPRFRRVKPRASPRAGPRIHSVEEVGRVLEHLRDHSDSWTGHRLHALTATVAYTGLRRDEALTLQLGDVDLATGILAVSDRIRRKTPGSAALVPIAPELNLVLASWRPRVLGRSIWLFPGVRFRGPWTGGAYGARAVDALKAAGQAVDVEGLTFASLRHTFATAARRRWGVSALELRDILRHTSPATQEWYLDPPSPAELLDSVSRISYRNL